ncbi:hypothetical protein SAMN05421507_12350 [Lentzea jiangxiensis]|uniref:Transposase DDE domain-containing protein n=1 Tax=Lentzea jiangxiensis TaxID=641025 RepID=A0A1H0WU31_9PSEU|nr:hypothetical protein SAMN05421507_12350 [Lentzea jiangxiensis]
MTTDLNTLLTALYVKIDDRLAGRTRIGRPPKPTDAELITLAVAQALLRFTSEARWLRFLPARMPGAFRYLPGQSGYNRRLRAALPLVKQVMRWLATDTDLWTDDTWDRRLHPGRMRPLPADRETLGTGRLGEIRLLPLTLPLVLGPAPAPGLHPGPGCPSPGHWATRKSTSDKCSWRSATTNLTCSPTAPDC